jgi:3-(3-hydroxy-phenyl)propionate hydroxylase
LEGYAHETLLDSYAHEREAAADENILNSTRSTDFITPKSDVSRAFRDATLELARDCRFAQRLVNSGRLSVATTYHASPLNTPDMDSFAGTMVPGAPAADAAIKIDGRPDWLLRNLGDNFTVLIFGGSNPDVNSDYAAEVLPRSPVIRRIFVVTEKGAPSIPGGIEDCEGLVAQRYDARPNTVYLLRPDGHVAARWRSLNPELVYAAMNRAISKTGTAR